MISIENCFEIVYSIMKLFYKFCKRFSAGWHLDVKGGNLKLMGEPITREENGWNLKHSIQNWFDTNEFG